MIDREGPYGETDKWILRVTYYNPNSISPFNSSSFFFPLTSSHIFKILKPCLWLCFKQWEGINWENDTGENGDSLRNSYVNSKEIGMQTSIDDLEKKWMNFHGGESA